MYALQVPESGTKRDALIYTYICLLCLYVCISRLRAKCTINYIIRYKGTPNSPPTEAPRRLRPAGACSARVPSPHGQVSRDTHGY